MIERFYLKEALSFKELSLEFDANLIIFTGPSGAGKSILMDALLSIFGLKDATAKSAEISLDAPMNLESIGIEEERPNIFRLENKKSTRYFINDRQVSKKNLKNLSSSYIHYLSLRDINEFESHTMVNTLDRILAQEDANYESILHAFESNYKALQQNRQELQQIRKEAQKITDLKEFAKFEIAQIEEIAPEMDEYEELMRQKKELSKKEKLEALIDEAYEIFTYESKISQVLSELDEESPIFDEAMNDIRIKLENAKERLDELNALDIEAMLNRLDKLADLKRKYGSIEESLAYLERKKEELSRYENIDDTRDELEAEIAKLDKILQKDAQTLHTRRAKALNTLKTKTNHYLKHLFLEDLSLELTKGEMHRLGFDEISITLNDTPLAKVSSGELNRIRLAYLAAKSDLLKGESGVLILDEIDANLSGKESMSVATVLEQLAKTYQLFAISHQPQLSSKAQMHFLVHKENGESRVKLLTDKERITELSRMISGEKVTKEAVEFAKSLLA